MSSCVSLKHWINGSFFSSVFLVSFFLLHSSSVALLKLQGWLLNSSLPIYLENQTELKTKHYIKSFISWNVAIGWRIELSFALYWMPFSDFNMHYSSNSNLITSEIAAHFFLFCVPAEPGQQKSFKRKRSLINWPFWRGSNSQLDGLPLSPTSLSPTQGRLFGRPLSSVCSPDHGLPKPVMVSWVEVT